MPTRDLEFVLIPPTSETRGEDPIEWVCNWCGERVRSVRTHAAKRHHRFDFAREP